VQGLIVVVATHASVTLVVLSCVRLANHTFELVLLLAQQQFFIPQTLLTSSDWLTYSYHHEITVSTWAFEEAY